MLTSPPTVPGSAASRLITLPAGLPEFTLGWEVVKWAAKYLKQPNGPHAGQRFQFTDTQLQFLLWYYAVDATGSWIYRGAIRRLAKGSGKSPFAALMALAELCAPVRFDRFDPAAPGGVFGKRVAMPWVQIAATSETQTENTMRMVRAFAPKGSRIVADFKLDIGKTRYNMAPEGKLEVITSSFHTAEGSEVTFVVGDETEWWVPSKNGPELLATLTDNLAKSGSRMLQTCNSWIPGLQSVAETEYAGWVKESERPGVVRQPVLYDARVAPPDTSLSDRDGLRSALELVYGDCWWQNIDPILDRCMSPSSKPDDIRRKYLNQPTAAPDAWVEPRQWDLCFDPDRVVADDEEVVLFFDGSRSRDATALIGCCMSDGFVFTVGVWEPNPNDDDSLVPVSEVDLAVRRAFDRYSVVGFFADVREWESFTKVSWPEEFADQLVIWAVPDGKQPQSIAWDMRSRVFEFGQACELTEAEIAERTLTHDGNSVLGRHVGNARRRPARGTVSIGKESPDSPMKIDAAVCMVGARMVRRLVLASPKWAKRHRSRSSGRVIVMS